LEKNMKFEEWLKKQSVFGPNELGYTEGHLQDCWDAAAAAQREACADVVRDWARQNDCPAAVSAADEIMRRSTQK